MAGTPEAAPGLDDGQAEALLNIFEGLVRRQAAGPGKRINEVQFGVLAKGPADTIEIAVGSAGDALDALGAAYGEIDIPEGAGEPIYPQEAKEALLLDHVTGADEWPPMVFSVL